MRRREAISAVLLLGTGVSLARAQAPDKVWRIGWLSAGSQASHANLLAAFQEGLREHGWAEGRNIALELRWAEGDLSRLPTLAAELIRQDPAVIVSAANPVHLVLRKQTSSIPIVMATGADPVAAGLAASFARPGGNVTGLSGRYDELPAKLLELTAAVLPREAQATVLLDRSTPFSQGEGRRRIEGVAKTVRLNAAFVEVATPKDVFQTLAGLSKAPPAAVIVAPSPMLYALGNQIVKEAAASRVPVISVFEEMTEAGGLLSYAVDVRVSYRRAAWYVDRILRGAQPGELPIEQATRISIALNLRTAKTYGTIIPQAVLLRADRVIE